jgi:alpha/beta superfamily hydrolase
VTASSDPVVLPGARDVRATLDSADEPADGDAVIVACPPHPQHGGSRFDSRLTAVSDALCERGVDCLRFDYGSWDEGCGERLDTRNALRWATDRYDAVGLFGYSFGATTALLAAGEASATAAPKTPNAVSVLAPDRGDFDTDCDTDTDRNVDRDAVSALDRIGCSVQIVYGERDTTVEWEPVAERARERRFAVKAMPADHFFVGQTANVGTRVTAFLVEHLH